MISMYPEKTPFPVYCRACWFSDTWDPLTYGKRYDFAKPFFEQFHELLNRVPRITLQISQCENCDYTNQIVNCKNCYLVFSGASNEDSYYSYRINRSKNMMDCFFTEHSERCYESSECRDSAELYFSQNIADGLNLSFCYDVRGASNCFMSSHLRRGSYYFRNQRISKEAYEEKIAEIDTGSYAKLESYKQEYTEMYLKSIHRFANSKNITNSTGHDFSNAKNSYYCFNGSNLENCRYMFFVNYGKDASDINNGDYMELCYENSTNGINAYNIKFSIDAWPDVRNLEYCDSCRGNVSDLFGCISVQKKQYCILNQQYSRDEYEELIPKIRRHMDEMPYTDARGVTYTYGEFFPMDISPFGYNETMAHDWFPLTKFEVLSRGLRWSEDPERNVVIEIRAEDLPDHVKDVPDNIVGKIIGCLHHRSPAGTCNQKCTTGFRITSSELQFYKSKNIALPRLCPNCRHYERKARLTGYALHARQCCCDYQTHNNTVTHPHHIEGRCPNAFNTPYAPERPEILYCEDCYNAEIA
ncbi:MAG: hypothetical protein NUV53_03875 [Patescibacteria group bacterium]|nr:hypothetical protein [Patescibacteria group bacterium]